MASLSLPYGELISQPGPSDTTLSCTTPMPPKIPLLFLLRGPAIANQDQQSRSPENIANRTFPPRLEIPQRTRDSHFHTATAAAGNGYIFNVSTAAAPVTFLNGLTRGHGLASCWVWKQTAPPA